MQVNKELKTALAIIPAAYAGGATPTVTKGPAIDRSGFLEGRVVLAHGVVEATALLDCKVQESNTTTDGDFVDVVDAAFAQLAGALVSGIYEGRLNLAGRKKYLRVVTTVTTNTKIAAHGAVVVLHKARITPVDPVNPLAFDVS
jgi:hypothetical protein